MKKLKPKVFLVENVPGLLWPRHAKYLDKFMSLARKHDYQVVGDKPFILNARDYGVPQNRKRAFILAVREDICVDGLHWPPVPTHTKLGPNSWKTASCVFECPPKSILLEFKERLIEKFNFSHDDAEKCINRLEWGGNQRKRSM